MTNYARLGNAITKLDSVQQAIEGVIKDRLTGKTNTDIDLLAIYKLISGASADIQVAQESTKTPETYRDMREPN